MKTSIFTIAILSSLTFTVPVSAENHSWQDLAGLAFQSIDSNGDRAVTRGEFSDFGATVFPSMDSDNSSSLSLGEFYSWGFGMHNAAREAGQTEAFKTAMRVVFALWDRDANNQVTAAEYRQSLDFDFLRADLDEDESLTEQEYRSGFSIVVAARAAIHPQSTGN